MIPNGSITVSSRRVLLIENSASDRQLLRTWLASDMIETYEAVDIITSLASCQKYCPNLILLQLRLHTWDGFEVIKRLKNDPTTRSIPVIFLAASALTAEKAKGIDMGAVDFVSKPFDSVELLARVNSALRTKALLDLLEQRAHLDGLTELGNRFALQDSLPWHLEASRQRNEPLSVVIADLDHFKRINDQYGHAAGDEVLRRAAMILRASFPAGDFLARYGGEEFVALCPKRELPEALALAERLRQSIADQKVGFRNQAIQMTASVGVAVFDGKESVEPADFIDRADQALYRAKSSGRNAVWYYDSASKKPLPANLALSTIGSLSNSAIAPPKTARPREATAEPRPVAVRASEG
ncbi:MAG: diguanylate cyclase [Isosphaeraceae bacterium]